MPTPLTSLPSLAANASAASTPTWILAGSLLAVLTPWLVKLSRARALAQPTPAHPAAEESVIVHVLRFPRHYVYVHQLRAEHFTDTRLGALWSMIAGANAQLTIPDVDGDSKRALRLLEACEANAAADLVERLAGAPLDEAVRDRFTALVAEHAHAGSEATVDATSDELIEQASLVYNAGVDRLEYVGNSRVELTGDPQQPLRRTLAPSGMLRRVVVALMLAVGGVLSMAVGAGSSDGTAGWLVTAALVILTIGSVVWALVDQDTMYIDLPTFYALTGAAWLLVIIGGILSDGLTGTLRGLLASLGVVVFIEVVNQVFRRVRGQHGMGGGDYLLIVATIGVPVAVTGDLLLGQWILILSLLAGIVGWVLTRLTKPGFTKASPYAFGPYLASGWLLALGLWVVNR